MSAEGLYLFLSKMSEKDRKRITVYVAQDAEGNSFAEAYTVEKRSASEVAPEEAGGDYPVLVIWPK